MNELNPTKTLIITQENIFNVLHKCQKELIEVGRKDEAHKLGINVLFSKTHNEAFCFIQKYLFSKTGGVE